MPTESALNQAITCYQ